MNRKKLAGYAFVAGAMTISASIAYFVPLAFDHVLTASLESQRSVQTLANVLGAFALTASMAWAIFSGAFRDYGDNQ